MCKVIEMIPRDRQATTRVGQGITNLEIIHKFEETLGPKQMKAWKAWFLGYLSTYVTEDIVQAAIETFQRHEGEIC